MATVTKPIALDESINTTEQTPRNIADVLAEELKGIADNILPPNASQIAYDNTDSGLTATNVQDAIDEVISSQADVIANTMADLTENKTATVTDGVADFETIDGSLVKSLVVEIVAKQSGTGTPSPDNIRPIIPRTQEDVTVVGKNRLPITGTTQTINGVTFTVNSDGTITANGTATANIEYAVYDANVSCPYIGYILSGCPSGGGNTTYEIRVSDVTVTSSADYGTGKTINITETGRWRVRIVIRNGVTVNNLVFKPMIRLATSSATFEPYHGKTYTIPFGQTVYGGTLDVLTGELTIDKGYVQITAQNVTFNSTNNRGLIRTNLVGIPYAVSSPNTVNCICDKFEGITQQQGVSTGEGVYAHGQIIAICGYKTSLDEYQSWLTDNPVTVVYEMETPQTVQLTPQTVKALVGENHISASTGDVTECKFSMLINGDDLEMLLS